MLFFPSTYITTYPSFICGHLNPSQPLLLSTIFDGEGGVDRTASCLFLGLPDHESQQKFSAIICISKWGDRKRLAKPIFFLRVVPTEHRLFKRTTSGPRTPISAPLPSTLLPGLAEKRNQAFFWSPAYQQAIKQKRVDKHPILLPSHPDYSTYYPPFPPEPKFLTITNHPEKRKKENSSFFRGGKGGAMWREDPSINAWPKKKANLRFLLLL